MGGDLGVRAATGAALVALILASIWWGPTSYGGLLLLLVVLGAREFESAWRKAKPSTHPLSRWVLAVVVLTVPAVSLAHMAGIGQVYDSLIPIGWFVLMWTNDTGAYLAGRTFGRHKLAPRISPGKTWEGLDGILCAVLVSLLGPPGDLAESWLKRKAGIKDSGHILPGHGGVLDRFDSHFFAAPIAAFVLMFF